MAPDTQRVRCAVSGRPDRRSGCARGARRRAFTLIELLVVIAIIVLILAFALPGMSAMHAQARLSSATQTINATLTRAYALSQGEMAMTAVRFLPAQWDVANDGKLTANNRQHLAVYRYIGTTERETSSGGFNVEFDEYFRRTEEIASAELAEDVWAAPVEALSTQQARLRTTYVDGTFLDYSCSNGLGRDLVLTGAPFSAGNQQSFAFDADRNNGTYGQLLNADDFLLVFEPRSGLRGGLPQPYRLKAYAPQEAKSQRGREVVSADPQRRPPLNASEYRKYEYYQRYGFSGVVIYPREAFLGQQGSTPSATAELRQQLLRDKGRPYVARRFGGTLVSATPGAQ